MFAVGTDEECAAPLAQAAGRGAYFFFNDWERYQRLGILLFARYHENSYTLIAVNTSDTEQAVPFWFPLAGDYVEELHGGDLNLQAMLALREVILQIPSNYGPIWTASGS